LRAKGLSAEEARVHSDPSYIPAANANAAPEPQLEDFTFTGGVVPVEEALEEKPDTEMSVEELIKKYGN
jgi:hypothetical protein